jgi:Leucine-rich repeat (LRR) protein
MVPELYFWQCVARRTKHKIPQTMNDINILINKLTNSQEIVLSYNELIHIPDSIGNLSNLHILDLSYNG